MPTNTIQQLSQHPEISKIVRFSRIKVRFTDDSGWLLEINTPTRDDAFVLYHDYGRIISKVAEDADIRRIRINTGDENMYSFSPKFRRSWV